MFDRISTRYDLLNHLLSMGMHKIWRNTLLRNVFPKPSEKDQVLDIATGTADLPIAWTKYFPNTQIVGIDLSENMILRGQQKIKKRGLKRIQLSVCDAEKLPFKDHTFSHASIGFGIRNFENPEIGLKNIYRVLKKNGQLLILELSIPNFLPFSSLFSLYFSKALPVIGGWLSGDREAYTYLWNSVRAFPQGKDMANMIEGVGFKDSRWKNLMGGICTLYLARK
ncbi:MAG: bifunctional demethylmenaquinone methyltransferase/2-methoxy-6-polyprenyl-1,4-benzoquinol methylase UbiE [Cytophagales bacterium]|nr:bifunctional demethylmenaquinone methyltransferase/2-methoxy-6-polyprenyl-1,4-benzoquinol methylase UbiE [Cytophagales bacterium]